MLKKGIYAPLLVSFLVSISGCTSNSEETQSTPPADIQADLSISSKADLTAFAQRVNAGETFAGKLVRLEKDVFLTADETPEGDQIEWAPICNVYEGTDEEVARTETGFKGMFDGNGRSLLCNINAFTPQRVNENGAKFGSSGIFGLIGVDGKVENLTIKGRFEGDISCAVSGVNKGTIANCILDATITQQQLSVGGFCGDNYGTIDNCEVRGEISCCDMSCSGVSSGNDGTISNCKVFAKIQNCKQTLHIPPDFTTDEDGPFQLPETGGIVAFNYGTITACTVESEISNKYKGGKYEGKTEEGKSVSIEYKPGFYGTAGGIVSTNDGVVENCSFRGTVSAEHVGGISGSNYVRILSCKAQGTVIGYEAAEFTSCNTYGDRDYTKVKELKEKQDIPFGLIQNCEFNGTVELKPDHETGEVHKVEKGAASTYIDDETKKPAMIGCKINGQEI